MSKTCVGETLRKKVWFQNALQTQRDLESFEDSKQKMQPETDDDMANVYKPPDQVVDIIVATFVLLGESKTELNVSINKNWKCENKFWLYECTGVPMNLRASFYRKLTLLHECKINLSVNVLFCWLHTLMPCDNLCARNKSTWLLTDLAKYVGKTAKNKRVSDFRQNGSFWRLGADSRTGGRGSEEAGEAWRVVRQYNRQNSSRMGKTMQATINTWAV